jgi:hypothetical protein
MWEGMMLLSWSVLLTGILPLLSRVTTAFLDYQDNIALNKVAKAELATKAPLRVYVKLNKNVTER